jgi:outer membrane protein assembly factor BamB
MKNLCLLAIVTALPILSPAADWPQFRGPDGQGNSAAKNLPVEWSETKNVTWKTPLPGLGWSSPVLVNGKIILTTAVPEGGGLSLRVLCVNAQSGKILWSTGVFTEEEGKAPAIHNKNSHASPTVVVDDGKVYAHFGHMGTACLDLFGKIVWEQNDLPYRPVHGGGGSPVIHKDLLIFNCDGAEEPFVAARNKKTGRLVWKTPRNTEVTKKFSFSTPLVIEVGGKAQIVSPGSGAVVAYEPETGKEIWRAGYGEGYSVIPRPVAGHGMIFVSSGYDRPIAYGIKVDAESKGDVTDSHIVWEISKRAPNSPSMLLVGEELYFVSDSGTASCVDAKTGEIHWSERVGGQTSASPTYADGKIYFLDEQGNGTVVAPGKEFKELGKNQVEGRTFASFAVDDGVIFLRNEAALFRIEQK